MTKNKSLFNRIITYALVCVTMFSCCLLAGIYAKYTSNKSESVSTDVKNFNITVNEDDTIANFSNTLSFAMNPQSEVKTYNFTITNASEVDVALKVTLETEGNLPLLFSYKIGENGTETNLTPDLDGNYSFNNTLEASASPSETKYTIFVKWDTAKKSYKYSNGVETVRLTLHAEQNNN